MALLDSLFGKSDPPRDWTRDPALVLLLDLDSHALCGARLGEPLERLRGLGPAEDRRAARRESFRYLSRGLEVDSESGALHGFVLVFKDDLREGFQPFQGRLRFRGEPIQLSGSSTEKDLVERFGQPYWRDEDRDEGEILLFYEWDGVE